ncbi:MAG: ATP-binding protein [Candidatus Hydrogenedentes bacterium]|nr:ATP-binding protein [Candidatus Hydrogenedentota bacterium]
MKKEQIQTILGETYAATRLPACGDAGLQEFYGRRIADAVAMEFSSQLYSVASQPDDSCAISLLWSFFPSTAPESKQSRLRLTARGAAHDAAVVQGIDNWLWKGALAGLYATQRIDPAEVDVIDFSVACDVVRMEQALTPVTTTAENPDVPSLLYEPFPLIPQTSNGLLLVDEVLNTLQEPVLIHICVMPEDTAPQRHALAKHCALLHEIGRSHWSADTSHEWFGEPDRGRVRRLPLPHRGEPSADLVIKNTQRVRENIRRPSVRFDIRILARNRSTALRVASAVATAAFKDGSYAIVTTNRGTPEFENLIHAVSKGHVAWVPPFECLAAQGTPVYYRDLERLRQIASPQELHNVFIWPVADINSPYCIEHSMDSTVTPSELFIPFGYRVIGPRGELGRKEGATNPERCLSNIAFGQSGVGKTLFLVNGEFEFHSHDTPFVSFEPVAGEQPAIKLLHGHPDSNIRRLAEKLQVFTFGPNSISEGVFNPFWRPKGVDLDRKVGRLVECFMGAVPSFPAFEAALTNAIYKLYRVHSDPQDPPRVEMLIPELRKQVKKLGYSQDVSQDLLSASISRFVKLCTGALGTIFRPGINVPSMEYLINGHTIIELDSLNEEEQSILLLLFLQAIEEQLLVSPDNGKSPRLAILFDELHLIAGSITAAPQSDQFVDTAARVSQRYCRMLREYRKLRVCIYGADQNPCNVAYDAVSQTQTMVAYRTTDLKSREILSGAMRLSSSQTEALAQLKPGFAYVSTPHSPSACLVKMRDFSNVPALLSKPSPEVLREACRNQPWRRAANDAIAAARLQLLSEATTAFATILVRRNREVERILKEKAVSLDTLARVHEEFDDEFEDFYHNSYLRLIGDGDGVSPGLEARRLRLQDEIENHAAPQARNLLDFMKGVLKRSTDPEDLS